jgi:competence protein ComGC
MKCSQGNPAKAFTLIEILCILAILFIMAVIFLPTLGRHNHHHSGISCMNNLHQIQKSFRMWAMDNQDKYPMQVSVTNGGTMELVNSGTAYVHFLVMSNEISTPKVLMCPEEDSSRKLATTFDQTPPAASPSQVPLTNDNSISYFVGVDADTNNPAMLLCGDGNIALGGRAATHGLHSLAATSKVTWRGSRHDKGGSVGLVDGSVQRVMNPDWPQLLLRTGQPTNRLALP